MSDQPQPPVDEPPGEQGAQAPNPPNLPPVPEWGEGENPPGTNPPFPPEVDPATVPVPGSVPNFDVGGDDPGTVPGPAGPPVNVDVPAVTQSGGTLTCTMGNWTNEPTTYSYVWEIEGVAVGGDTPTYTVTPADVGMTVTCTVTASNAQGSATAPPSAEVTIA